MATLTFTKNDGNFYLVNKNGTSKISGSTYAKYNSGDGQWIKISFVIPVGSEYKITNFDSKYLGGWVENNSAAFGYGLTKENRTVYTYSNNSNFTYKVGHGTYSSDAGNRYKIDTDITLDAGTWHLYIYATNENGAFQYINGYNNTSLTITYEEYYIISYDKNGGTGSMESVVVKAGASITLPSNSFAPPTQALYTLTLNGNGGNNGSPTFTKNTFYRWYDGSKNYEEGKTYQPTAGITIKARWRSWYKHGTTTRSPLEENGYVVTLNPLGGTCKENSLTSKKITKYTFDYWNKNSDGSNETKYDTSSEYWLAQDDTRYAIWKQSVSYSSITLPTPQHVTTSTLSITLKYQNEAADSTKTSTKTISKAFKGWATSQSATSGITGQYTPSSNHTLYAIWDISTTTYSQVTNLPNPIRPGYDFLGWATSASASSGVFNTYTPTSDIGVLYAIWTPSGTVRIYLDSTNKYKMAMMYIYNPTSDNDTKPWKLLVPYIKDSSSWKMLGG